jgi:hypothetical protein
VINESVPTGRLRFITKTASTARCFGVPSGTGAPSTVICSGPSTPNPILFSVIRGNSDPLGA